MATQNPPPRPGGNASVLNITAATVIKALPGTIWSIQCSVAGSATGSINDCKTTGTVAAGNKIAGLANTLGTVFQGPFPAASGIVITPGTGQTLSISYS